MYKVLDLFMSERLTGSFDPTYPSISALSQKSQNMRIRHYILNKFNQWVPGAVQPHGKVKLNVKLSQSAQTQLYLPPVGISATTVQALADSGAQMCVADWDVAARLNLIKADLLHPALKVSVADNTNLRVSWRTFPVNICGLGRVN